MTRFLEAMPTRPSEVFNHQSVPSHSLFLPTFRSRLIRFISPFYVHTTPPEEYRGGHLFPEEAGGSKLKSEADYTMD